MNILEYAKMKKILGGSGGGGVSSWNDLKDKPFGEEVTKSSFIDSLNLSFTSGKTGMFDYTLVQAVNNAGGFVVDKTYIVAIDNEQYECICVSAPNPTPGGSAVKELHPVGDHNVKVSYALAIGGYQMSASVTDGSHSVEIYEKSIEVIPIDEKYLPDSLVLADENGKIDEKYLPEFETSSRLDLSYSVSGQDVTHTLGGDATMVDYATATNPGWNDADVINITILTDKGTLYLSGRKYTHQANYMTFTDRMTCVVYIENKFFNIVITFGNGVATIESFGYYTT